MRLCLIASKPTDSVIQGFLPAAGEPDVLLSFWPLRENGDRIVITHTNRDYLGGISAIGADASAVERAVAATRAAEGWAATGPRP